MEDTWLGTAAVTKAATYRSAKAGTRRPGYRTFLYTVLYARHVPLVMLTLVSWFMVMEPSRLNVSVPWPAYSPSQLILRGAPPAPQSVQDTPCPQQRLAATLWRNAAAAASCLTERRAHCMQGPSGVLATRPVCTPLLGQPRRVRRLQAAQTSELVFSLQDVIWNGT